jgi:hypothetical protein
MTKISNLKATPIRDLKPHLVFVGRLLGMDLFIDIHGQRNVEDKLALADAIIKEAFEPKTENNL